ncbi:MAG TPA: hypothetical protein VIK37_00150 [Candidatus Saccharimonadales bacterium]
MTKRGHQQPNFDNQSQLNIFSERPAAEVPVVEQPTFQPPYDVRPLVRARLKDAERRFDILDAQAIRTSEQVRKEIGRSALTPEDIEAKEVAEVRKGAKPSKRPKKDRRHLGARQKNIADGDARVKAEYDMLSYPGEQDARQATRITAQGILDRDERKPTPPPRPF